jgi:23S rRNA-/tRNA-specific pseudouridylate synthase
MEQTEPLSAEHLRRIADSFFSAYWRWDIEVDAPIEATVEGELAKRLPHIAVGSWPERFDLGGVYLGGKVAKLGDSIVRPCRLEYYEPKVPLEHLQHFYPTWGADHILYQDADLAVVIKPAGLPTTPARDQSRYHLQGYLGRHFASAVHTPSRLDTGVSGLLICSLSSRMNRYLQKAYDRRWIEKIYLAEVDGAPSWSRKVCEQSIERDPRHPVLRRCSAQIDQGERAKTRLLRIFSEDDDQRGTTLLRAEPLTGRTHQIRVHCQYEGFSIIGDPYYGGRAESELRLVSFALGFFHPYLQKRLNFELPPSHRPSWLRAIRFPPVEMSEPAG